MAYLRGLCLALCSSLVMADLADSMLNTLPNSTIVNPMLPGWHSDPSCVFVAERDNTFFCATSTFLVTPGIPIYASKDLVNWKLASNVLSRPSQAPYFNTSGDQNDGIFAPTLRYHNGAFYLITVYVFRVANSLGEGKLRGLLFISTNPFDDGAWSEPVRFAPNEIDPDIFWHENGKIYVTSAGTKQATLDIDTGEISPSYSIWNGTGGPYPEGPHIYFKDDYYYLLIGEGGTELNHSVTIARSKAIDGPYESYESNPILTARGTNEYFQTVGHADLFQDASGKWWGAALSTRSGPEWKNYPMGRETILTPVTWTEGEWPIMQRVEGEISAWPLPARNLNVPGKGPFLGQPDVEDFEPGSSIPPQFLFWRWPAPESYIVSPSERPYSLRLKPSGNFSSSTTDIFAGTEGITFVSRLQEHTLFTYSVDILFEPKSKEEEVGVTVFLTQQQHLDLGIVYLYEGNISKSAPVPHLRLQATFNDTTSDPVIKTIPRSWSYHDSIQLRIQAANDTHYTFSASPSTSRQAPIVLGSLPATIVSGGTGPFTGSLIGVYYTSHGTNNTTGNSYISRWRYHGDGQKIDHDTFILT